MHLNEFKQKESKLHNIILDIIHFKFGKNINCDLEDLKYLIDNDMVYI